MGRVNLFSTRAIYPVTKGDQTIIAQRLRVLSRDYALRVFLIGNHNTREQTELARAAGLDVEFVCVPTSRMLIFWRIFSKSLLGLLPLQVAIFSSRKLQKVVKSLPTNEISIVYTIRAATEFFRPNRNTIIEAIDSMEVNMDQLIDIESDFIKGALLRLEHFLLVRNEKRIIDRFSISTFVAQRDLKRSGNQRSVLLPNGMESADFPVKEARDPNSIRFVFSGNFAYAPNIDAARFLVELFRKVPEGMSLTFVGVGGDWLNAYTTDRIRYVGPVADMIKKLSEYDIYLCPVFKSSGIQNKVLEGSAAGLPVFMSKRVARAFNVPTEYGVGIDEDFNSWFTLIAEIQADTKIALRSGSLLQNFLKDNYSWENIKNLLDASYK